MFQVSKSKTPNQFKKTRGVVVETTTFCVVSATQLTLRTTETTETFSFGFWLHPPETAFTLSHTSKLRNLGKFCLAFVDFASLQIGPLELVTSQNIGICSIFIWKIK